MTVFRKLMFDLHARKVLLPRICACHTCKGKITFLRKVVAKSGNMFEKNGNLTLVSGKLRLAFV